MAQLWLVSFAILISTQAPAQSKPYIPESILIRNITVIDMISSVPLPPQDVLLENGVISSIAPGITARGTKLKVVNGTGKFLIPGLIDSHAHLIDSHSPKQRNIEFQEDEFLLLLINGVTSVRNMKSFRRQLKMSNEIAERRRLAPRIFVFSPAVEAHPVKIKRMDPKANFACEEKLGWSNCTIRNARGGAELAQSFQREGFHGIKIREPIGGNDFLSMAENARKTGLSVAGHVYDFTLLPQIMEQNLLHSIEHPYSFFELFESAGSPYRKPPHENSDLVSGFFLRSFHTDAKKMRAFMAKSAKKFRGFFVPTLVQLKYESEAATEKTDVSLDPDRKSYFDDCWNKSRNAVAEEIYNAVIAYRNHQGPDTFRKAFLNTLALTQQLYSNGVKFAAGTDFGGDALVPGISLHDELELLVMAGLSPLDSLKAGTLHGAELLRDSQLGVIRVGAKADVIVLDANPLLNIKNTRKIHSVVRDGVLIDKKTIESTRLQIKAHAAKFNKCGPS